jgi:hypothetical protein
MTRIPKILHYCFGMKADFGGKPWSLMHYVCVASAIRHLKPEAVHFYYEYEPSGPWWDLTKPLVTPVKIEAPREIFGRPVSHPAHRAGVVRLQKLIEHGGIYLDADALVQRSFDDLLENSVVLGREGSDTTDPAMADAIILAEREAPFLKRWLNEYRWFRGDEGYWGEHAVLVPARLAREHPEEITVLPSTAFFLAALVRRSHAMDVRLSGSDSDNGCLCQSSVGILRVALRFSPNAGESASEGYEF